MNRAEAELTCRTEECVNVDQTIVMMLAWDEGTDPFVTCGVCAQPITDIVLGEVEVIPNPSAPDPAVVQAQIALTRAMALNSAPAELAALQVATLAAEGITPGDPWRQPTGAHDAYPLGAIVSHGDENWKSTTAANVWEPGVSGWAIEGEGIPPWVQPTGAHDAYPLGAVVTHLDKFWKSAVDANVWEPPTLWTEIQEP